MLSLKSRAQIAQMRRAGLVVCDVLDAVEEAARPGVSTLALAEVAERVMTRAGARSAFVGYAPGGRPPYPAVLCTSVNAEVVHGIPNRATVLREGDIISIDFACSLDGLFADAARTVGVGRISAEAQRLIDAAYAALEAGIAMCTEGHRLQDIGHAIERSCAAGNYGVVRDYCGHGIGRAMHEAPQVPNYGSEGRGPRLRPGLVLALEPMLTLGGDEVVEGDDGWTVVTADGALSAHVEHSVALTADGPFVLTRREPTPSAQAL
jgi:methionyl aminopeptidase